MDAKGLVSQINELPFVVQLHIMKNIFNTRLALSNFLQNKGLDLAKACVLVNASEKHLENVKKDDGIYKESLKFAQEYM